MSFSIKSWLSGLSIVLLISSCGGGGGGGAATSATPALNVPTGLSAAAGNATNSISWAASSGATSYNLYWSTATGVNKTNGTQITGVTSPYSHTGLANGTSYYYVVTAVYAGGEGAESTQVSAIPQSSVTLTVPTGVSAMARDANNLLSWSAVSGATSYNLYWSTTSGVNKSTGTKIALANRPQAHTGLVNGTVYYYVVTAVSSGGESAESAQVNATPVAATDVSDPLYSDQWHLKNTGQAGASGPAGAPGEDMNVESVWASRKGNGVRIAIVDDGLEMAHEDLATNIAANSLSYNYVTGSNDPSYDPADLSSGHGTAVAGIVAARDLNGLGGRGVAPRANLVGYNLLENKTSSNEADAMTRGSPDVHIYSNSWGAPDNYGKLDASVLSWRTAIDNGITNGRGGLGAVYVWAAGNGAPTDNSNYDGQANYRGVIAVGAVNDQGVQSIYSESGANLLISAPGGEYCDSHAITTTDRSGSAGENSYNDAIDGYTAYDYANTNYTKCMNGTSAAVPAVAGVAALMLEENPGLSWRDVRLILAQSARMNDAADPGWSTGLTVPAYHHNHKYGFGVIDAQAAVTLASGWTKVGPQLSYSIALAAPFQAIPDNNPTGISHAINVAGSGITRIEFIEITFTAKNHTYSGDLEVTLTSPAGTVSRLAETHACAGSCTRYDGWVFGSVRHLGEAVNGIWKLTVKDGARRDIGTFQSWKLKFFGS